MLITKREEVTKQGSCKILWRKLRLQGSLLLEFIHSSGWVGGEGLFEFDWKEVGVGAYSNKYGMRFSLAFLLGNVQQADVFLIAIT